MYRQACVVLTLLFMITHRLDGQPDPSENRVISGIIVDDSLGHVIPSVHIWNESRRVGCISNDSGAFSVKLNGRDTLVFSAVGYLSRIMVVSSSWSREDVIIRLEPQRYVIGEVVIRRFRSYESFLYEVAHTELPEPENAGLKAQLAPTLKLAALEADQERANRDKLETGRFGYITPLGKGVNQQKVFQDRMRNLGEREKVIQTKFNRELVGEITRLEGDELTEFIALCNFSEEYLYETDLYTIMEELYAKLADYQSMTDTLAPAHKH